ncbi:MAG: 6,7-dimethyl-8-ribityllumazine synthase, partial [Bacteroidaceae bacterium]|nr:6,7-dimethyl-8-ribityllumazine synthase [Bacteroidaceae bacterium]
MATAFHNLSDYDAESVPDASGMRFGIVVSEWNSNITGALLEGAVTTLKKHGAQDKNILVQTVPGSFELTFGSAQMVKSGKVDAVIAIGCVIRGDTPHFDYVCMGATNGITQLNAMSDIPVIYGLITTNNMQQAEDRC